MKYLFRKPSFVTMFYVGGVSVSLLLWLPHLILELYPGFVSGFILWISQNTVLSNYGPLPFRARDPGTASEIYRIVEEENELLIYARGQEGFSSLPATERYISMRYYAGEYKAGFWAPTRLLDAQVLAHHAEIFGGMPMNAYLPGAQRMLEIRAELVAAEGLDPRLVTSQHIAESTVILSGYFINGLSALGVCGLLWTIAWVPVHVRDRRRQTRAKAGPCPMCAYDLKVTPDQCPECGWGHEVGADEADAD